MDEATPFRRKVANTASDPLTWLLERDVGNVCVLVVVVVCTNSHDSFLVCLFSSS